MKIVLIAPHDQQYPRNRMLREAVEYAGHSLSMVNEPSAKSYLWRSILLYRAIVHERPHAIVLSALANKFIWVCLILRLRLRIPLICDYFVSLFETEILDWQRARSWSLRSAVYRATDTACTRLADGVLVDNEYRAANLRTGRPVVALPVGAPAWASPAARPPHSHHRLLFYGNLSPLHGLPSLFEALADCPEVHNFDLILVGTGQHLETILAAARRVPFRTVNHVSHVSETEIARLLSHACATVGHFGVSKKAASVIPNKVWQSLMSGVPTITRHTEANNEIRSICFHSLVEVDIPLQPDVLNEHLRLIATDCLLHHANASAEAKALRLKFESAYRLAVDQILLMSLRELG